MGSFSQTTDISGIVNTYHRVVEIIPAKACVRVADISGLDVNSYIMLVQMKGASINTSTGINFGDTLSLEQAGNYEIGTVCYIIGDSVFLFHDLMNTYNTATGKVQLVQFGQYYSANVVDTVKAAPWDSAAGTGGVIAIFADQDITLNRPVYADSLGFRGGKYIQYGNGCANGASPLYVYDGNATGGMFGTNTGAFKGEGIANLTTALTGGRGAPANGGGGGNNHNNSGGGGANLFAGGRGGGNSSASSNCNTERRGEAGKALSSWNGTKIFPGGGGGAGHNNHGIFRLGGGNGGGIIFIWANNMNGNGQLISANGGAGGQSQADGAGGGGAGGTIIMHIANYSSNPVIRANGGKGGNSNDAGNVGYCYGGGGGGSGGVIYFTGAAPAGTHTVAGGLAGVESGRDATCLAERPSLPGEDGLIVSNYTFSRSFNEAGYCQLLLPVDIISFYVQLINKKVLLKWEITNPSSVDHCTIERSADGYQWTGLGIVRADEQLNNYSAVDNDPLSGKSYYRIRFVEKDNSTTYSQVRMIIQGNTNEFVVYPNPAKSKLTITRNDDNPAPVIVYDLTGRVVFQSMVSSATTTIDITPVPAGTYLIKINGLVKKMLVR